MTKKDRKRRTIAKTITFRILASLTTIALVGFFTKSVKIAGIVGVLEFFLKLVLYYAHERTWECVDWGK